MNSLIELRTSPGGVSAKRKWFCRKQRVARVVEVSGSEASQPFQPAHPINTASETTRDTDHDEAKDLSAGVPEVSATTSSELPTENTSSEENTQSGEKSGK